MRNRGIQKQNWQTRNAKKNKKDEKIVQKGKID